MTSAINRRATLAAAAALAVACTARAQNTEGPDVGAAQIPSAGGDIAGLFAKPAGSGPFPIVLVAESGNGLSRLMTDSCRGLAKEGFLAVAPALFAGSPPDGTIMQRLAAAAAWAGQNGGDPARLGIVGFGAGGRAAWLYDAYSPALKAAIVWYGPLEGATSPSHPTTALDAAAHLHAPLLGLYGKGDTIPRRVLLDAEARAKQAGKTADIVSYVGAGPDFAAAGTPAFDQAATLDGWSRTLAWLRDHGVR